MIPILLVIGKLVFLIILLFFSLLCLTDVFDIFHAVSVWVNIRRYMAKAYLMLSYVIFLMDCFACYGLVTVYGDMCLMAVYV